MATELYHQGEHRVLLFTDLVKGEAIQSNQMLIVHGDKSALFDPGGDLTFTALNMAMAFHKPIKELTYLCASHQDPDILSSLDSWFRFTSANVVIPAIWQRFLEHLLPQFMNQMGTERFIPVPDAGMRLPFGDDEIIVLPAHFLHSVGNVSFFDPSSGTLFSGDIGASMVGGDAQMAVDDFDDHVGAMIGFHRRYMVSNKICRYWAHMIRQLDVQTMVPQHGKRFEGPAMIARFLNWFERLECGTDWVTQADYQVP